MHSAIAAAAATLAAAGTVNAAYFSIQAPAPAESRPFAGSAGSGDFDIFLAGSCSMTLDCADPGDPFKPCARLLTVADLPHLPSFAELPAEPMVGFRFPATMTAAATTPPTLAERPLFGVPRMSDAEALAIR